MPTSLVRIDYLLSEAFELMGRHLYGPEWTGNELTARRAPPPEELARNREPLREAIAKLDSECDSLREEIARTVRAGRIAELNARLNSLRAERSAAFDKLARFPEPGAHHREDHARWLRRQEAERVLTDALAAGRIEAYTLAHFNLPARLWAGEERPFAYFLELSLVRVPRTFSSRRHQSARIREADFDIWLAEVPRVVPLPDDALPMRQRCRVWLRRLAAGPKTKSKPAYYRDAARDLPGLSRAMFDSEWKVVMPPAWQEGGRLSKSKS